MIRCEGKLSKYPSQGNRGNPHEHQIVTVHVDGYFSGYPARAGEEFYHFNQQLRYDTNSPHTLNCPKKYWNVIHGSSYIGALLFDSNDERLAKFRTDASKRVAASFNDSDIDITLEDAIEAARNYIEACSDPIVRELDIENCQGIGGRMHIATITPTGGFKWAPGYEPLT
ncbi:MAG: hypothetical protein ACR2IV_21065 [Bryobacteraceae bacterium]